MGFDQQKWHKTNTPAEFFGLFIFYFILLFYCKFSASAWRMCESCAVWTQRGDCLLLWQQLAGTDVPELSHLWVLWYGGGAHGSTRCSLVMVDSHMCFDTRKSHSGRFVASRFFLKKSLEGFEGNYQTLDPRSNPFYCWTVYSNLIEYEWLLCNDRHFEQCFKLCSFPSANKLLLYIYYCYRKQQNVDLH